MSVIELRSSHCYGKCFYLLSCLTNCHSFCEMIKENCLGKASPQPLASIYPKSLEYLGAKFHLQTPSSGSCLSLNSTSEKARQMVSPPRKTEDHSHRVFKLPLREQTHGFLVFLPHLLSEGLESHQGALESIKPGPLSNSV